MLPPAFRTRSIAEMERLAKMNTAAGKPSFLGAGAYSHFRRRSSIIVFSARIFYEIHAVHPEISRQLCSIFSSFKPRRSMTGMDVANASMI